MEKGLTLGDIAKKLDIAQGVFSILYMREELPDEKKKMLYKIIDEVADEYQRIQEDEKPDAE